MKNLMLIIVLLVFASGCNCGGGTTAYQRRYDRLIKPVTVIDKRNNEVTLEDAKDNRLRIRYINSLRWGDSIIRNHKVGDIVGKTEQEYSEPEYKSDYDSYN